jgi:hypothetical protein
MTQEKFTLEAAIHFVVHFLGVLLIFWMVIVPPLWLSIILLLAEYLQIRALGNCFLTVFAHKRGYMQGMSYWEYFFYIFGVKRYKEAKVIVDNMIKVGLVGILVGRLILSFV